jgi:hypothetical protein
MGQKFCTACGSALSPGVKFCESCGAAIEPSLPASPLPASSLAPTVQISPEPAGTIKSIPLPKIIAGIVIVLVLLAGAAYFFVLPKLSGGSFPPVLPGTTGTPAPLATPVVTESVPATVATTVVPPTPTPNPFTDAFKVKELFNFNEGKYTSRATVYRYWMNATYQWHNDIDNRYYTEKPKQGFKFLFVLVNIENIGKDGYPYPKSSMIRVHNDGDVYYVDPTHYLPDKATNREAVPVEIKEVETQSDYFNLERVEDYGYSHGTTQDFVYPGQGNAVDGYLIYQVPVSLKPEDTYVEIQFDSNDRAAWKLG